MREWWEQREFREQLILGGAAFVLVMLLYFLLIWEPLYKGLHQQRASLAETRSLTGWLAGIAPEIRAAGPSTTNAGGNRSMLAVVDASTREAGLAPQVKRMQPDGETTVRVWIENAPLDTVLRWINALHERYGITTNQLNMDRGRADGTTTARLTLER